MYLILVNNKTIYSFILLNSSRVKLFGMICFCDKCSPKMTTIYILNTIALSYNMSYENTFTQYYYIHFKLNFSICNKILFMCSNPTVGFAKRLFRMLLMHKTDKTILFS